MSYQLVTHKIEREHLERCAYIYVRQSTLQQVRENTTSTQRQYDLSKLAAELGWEQEKIVVVDQDQARSGASTEGRDGFKTMLSEIALGNVGAVISLEASRLARDSSAWHQLLKICEVTKTLVIDEIGIYDPRDRDDRLLLGFKGTMSEVELSPIVSRMTGAKKRKAQEGQLKLPLPIGYVHNIKGEVIFDPNEEIQHIVRLLFDTFDRLSSVRMLVREFNSKGLLFPRRSRRSGRRDEIEWVSLTCNRALCILHHPGFAGTYVYGRTTSYKCIDSELSIEVVKRIKKVNINEWEVLRLNNHEGYISWEKFINNQKRIADNIYHGSERRPGAIRAGTALLQGLALCGKCGQRLSVGYPKGKKYPKYYCNKENGEYATGKYCHQLSGRLIDKAVANAFLQAIRPVELQLSIKTVERLESEMKRVDKQWELRVENAQYEADLSRRRFIAVDPENRLVTRNLEREWNEMLAEVNRLKREKEVATKAALRTLNSSERQAILDLARELPKVWNAETTTQIERKQLLRYLIKDITIMRDGRIVHLTIRWQTTACTQVNVTLNTTPGVHKTDPEVIATISKLALTHTDREIADYLNEAGIKSQHELTFSKMRVGSLRRFYDIPSLHSARSAIPLDKDGRCSVRAAARILNVRMYLVTKWCQQGRLDAVKSKPNSYWWINLTPEKIAELKRLNIDN